MTFTTANWNIPQTVTVTGVADADATNESVIITQAVKGADYQTVISANVTATVTDKDTAGVTNSELTITLGEASTGTYTVKLNTQPTGEVTITPSSGKPAAATVSTAMTFTTANWNTPQTVTVTGVADADATNESVIITQAVKGADYQTVISANVTATVTDKDTAGVTNSELTITLGEASTGTYTVKLNTQPTGEVTITPTSGKPAAATVSTAMTFTTANWNTPQTVTVTGVADADATNESVTITQAVKGADYQTVISANVTATVTDKDTAGVTNSELTITLGEASTGTYTVKLNTQPTGEVTITPTSGKPAAATVSTAMTFTTANWNIPQTVTVTGVADADATNESVIITQAVKGADYKDVTSANVTATVTDKDTAGVTNSETAITLGEASTGTYTVVLNTQPTGEVTITPTSGKPAAATVSTAMTFTTANWNIPQTVTVTGVADADATNESVIITQAVKGADYQTVISANVTATVTDKDTAGVTNSELTITLGEASTGTYTVKLNTQPTGEVTITPTSGKPAAATVSTAMTFTTANWNTPQTVTVTGVADADATNESVIITQAVKGADYQTVISANVTATVTDKDTAGVTNSELTITLGEASTGTYTVKLNTQPTGEVTITPTSGKPAAATVSTAMTFTTANWNIPQTVTVTGVADADATNESVIITQAVKGADYETVISANVTATVTDKDTAGVTNSELTITLGEASTGTYTVKLNTQPTGEVTITPTSGKPAAATVSTAMTFTTANWNTPQTVTVTGVADADATNESVIITQAVKGADYQTVISANVTATVTDKDTAGVTNSETAITLGEASTGTYTVKLNTQPTGEVTITPTSGKPAAATVSTAMTFTTANWNIPQTVTVTGVADADATNESVIITQAVKGADYETVISANVTATVTDKDTAGVTNSETAITLGEASTGTYTVVLNTQPTGERDHYANQ